MEKRLNKKLITLFGGEIYGLHHNDEIYTTPLFWDCECKYDYIHPKSQPHCDKCGMDESIQPDSRINEVVLYVMDLYNMGDKE